MRDAKLGSFAAPVDGCGPSIALLWIEGPAGVSEGRSGGAWDAALPPAGMHADSPPAAAATWLAPPARTVVGGYGASLSLRAPGRYALGVFVDGQLVGAPFVVLVLPAAPAAAASELLLPLSALSLNPYNETSIVSHVAPDSTLPALRAAWADAASVFAGDTKPFDTDASAYDINGPAAWTNALARAASLLERALGPVGTAAASLASVISTKSDVTRDTFNVLLAASVDPLARTASRVADDGTLPGAPPITETAAAIAAAGGKSAFIPRSVSPAISAALVGKREPILIAPLKGVDALLRAGARAVRFSLAAGGTKGESDVRARRSSWNRDAIDALAAPRAPLAARLRDAAARAPLTPSDAARNVVYVALRRADTGVTISRAPLVAPGGGGGAVAVKARLFHS